MVLPYSNLKYLCFKSASSSLKLESVGWSVAFCRASCNFTVCKYFQT